MPLESAHLQATSLWELVLEVVAMLLRASSSDSLMQLRDRKGERDEKRRGENHECGERGNDRKRSIKWKKDGDEETSTQWEETLFSIPLFQQAIMKTKVNTLAFYTMIFWREDQP